MWLNLLRVLIVCASGVDGTTVKAFKAMADCSLYRARLIVREAEHDGLIFRRGNSYYYNNFNSLSVVMRNVYNPKRIYDFEMEGEK